MRRTVTALACAAVLVLSGCGSGAETPAAEEAPADEPSFATEAPAPEQTEEAEAPDDPAPANEPVALQLPGLPVGGGSERVSKRHQCVDVGWSDPPDMPPWIEVQLTGLRFWPHQDFELSNRPCPGKAPDCTDPGFRLTNTSRCALSVAWTQPTQTGRPLLSFPGGTIVCPASRVQECETFLRAVKDRGQQDLELKPSPPEFGEDEDSQEGAEDQADDQRDEPSTGSADDSSPDQADDPGADPGDDATDDPAGGTTDGSTGSSDQGTDDGEG